MGYTHRIIWTETLTTGVLRGTVVTKTFKTTADAVDLSLAMLADAPKGVLRTGLRAEALPN